MLRSDQGDGKSGDFKHVSQFLKINDRKSSNQQPWELTFQKVHDSIKSI